MGPWQYGSPVTLVPCQVPQSQVCVSTPHPDEPPKHVLGPQTGS